MNLIQKESVDFENLQTLLACGNHSFSANFRKTNISNSLIHTRTYAYQGVRNVSFSENFANVLNHSNKKGKIV